MSDPAGSTSGNSGGLDAAGTAAGAASTRQSDGSFLPSTIDSSSRRLTLGSGRINPDEDMPAEYQENPQAWYRILEDCRRLNPGNAPETDEKADPFGRTRRTKAVSSEDMRRWANEHKTRKLAVVGDNHSAMMKALSVDAYKEVPLISNVRLHTEQETVKADLSVLVKGSRWFRDYFRYKATEPMGVYVSSFFLIFLLIKNNSFSKKFGTVLL
jgi:hypothetical protein